jgi:hypothetical protein
MKWKRGITIRLGPLGMSLAAAGITAVAFAAVSLADNGSSDNSGNGTTTQTFQMPAPGGGVGAVSIAGPNLSAEDRQKMEDFRKCMEDNGAPAPPDPGEFDPSNPPKPPSEAELKKLKEAFDACKDKLPSDMQNAGPPRIGTFKCGPPPGAPGADESGKNQSNDSGTSSSGAAS